MNDYRILSELCKFGVKTMKGISSGNVGLSINNGVLTITWNSETGPTEFRIRLSTIRNQALKIFGLEEHTSQTANEKQKK